jgi:hypothetical protein
MYTFHVMAPKKCRWGIYDLLHLMSDLTVYSELTEGSDCSELPVPTTVVAGVHGLVSSLEAIDSWAKENGDVLIVTSKGTKLWLGNDGRDALRRRILEDWPLRWG